MKYSLGLLLALCLAGLQLVAVTTVVYSSYISSERVLLEHARSLLSDAGANTTTHSRSFLDPAKGAAELAARLAESEIVSSDNPQLLEQLLFRQLQTAAQFAGIFYGDSEGNFVYVNRSDGVGPFRSKLISRDLDNRQTDLIWRGDAFEIIEQRADPEDTYDPRARPWYQKAEEELGSVWTDPYIFFSSQLPGITIAAPVIDEDGTVNGVIGVDIEINAISEFLAHLKIGENGAALIINRNGDVIAHPSPNLLKAETADGNLRFVSIDEIADPAARAAFGPIFAEGGLSVTQEKFAEFSHAGEVYVSTIMPEMSSELPWTIALYAPERDFIGAIKENRVRDLWIAAAVALITGLIGLALAHFIHRPVRAFAVRSSLISQGEIEPSAPMPKTYSELEQANQTLTQQIRRRRASEREYGLTFDMASRGMAQMHPTTGAFLRVNEKFAEILGYSVEEMLTLSRKDLTHPDDPTIQWDMNEINLEDHAVNLEKRCIRKDKQAVWLKINAIMIRDGRGDPLHAVATIDDISETRAAEDQIQKLNRDMSHLARGELLGQMAAGLAHELNQPLSAITLNTDAALLTVQNAPDPDEELVQILGELDQQAHRAGDIIKALRSFARKDDEWKIAFDLNELLVQSSRLLQAEVTEHDVVIRNKVGALPLVSGIRVQVAQVIVNLLRNAIEAMASNKFREVTVTAKVDGTMVVMAVEDTGPGVDPSINLFDQFETTKARGMGLGLSICRSITEANGGQLWHDVSYQSGARFCFSIPIHID